MRILLQHNRIRYFQQIVDGYLKSVNERKGIVSARVTAAAPLSPENLKSLEAKLAGITGKRVNMESQTDANLLGGIVVQIGSTIFDGSIRTQLSEMKRRLTETRSFEFECPVPGNVWRSNSTLQREGNKACRSELMK